MNVPVSTNNLFFWGNKTTVWEIFHLLPVKNFLKICWKFLRVTSQFYIKKQAYDKESLYKRDKQKQAIN